MQFLYCRAVRRSWTRPLPRAVPEQLAAHFFLGLQSLPRSSFLHWGSVKDSAKTRLTLWMSLESRIVPGKRRWIFLIATCAADLDFLHGFRFSKATIIHYKKEIFRAFCWCLRTIIFSYSGCSNMRQELIETASYLQMRVPLLDTSFQRWPGENTDAMLAQHSSVPTLRGCNLLITAPHLSRSEGATPEGQPAEIRRAFFWPELWTPLPPMSTRLRCGHFDAGSPAVLV